MNILLIEDEKLAAEKLTNLLTDIGTHFNILAVLDSVEDSIAYLKREKEPDLILSDIHLTDGLCFSIFSAVEIDCPVIFTTAYEKYAIQAFEVNSIDYLLKPIQKDRLQNALDKYLKLGKHSREDQLPLYEEFRKLLSNKNKEHKSRFLCKLGNKIKSVPVDSIRYFYSESKLTFIIDMNGQRYPVNHTLDEIDQIIDPSLFFRLNRKYIAHFDSINEIHPYFKGRMKLVLKPDVKEDIIVSSEKAPLFRAWLDK